ncbi:hypothetical protein L2E82_08165 [Cichorium intybus]|uniref:Uncharacterized protein n=1 Tax=Cichorium intybus TaxID=13427 RepID=A0ACB9G6X0_CICIN|nr:hypothetical protein L2E82_08165 [Cichorium intybus]
MPIVSDQSTRDVCFVDHCKVGERGFLQPIQEGTMAATLALHLTGFLKLLEAQGNTIDRQQLSNMYVKPSLTKLKKKPRVSSMHTGLCYPSELASAFRAAGITLSGRYESLMILDMESLRISSFPSDVIQLGNLRYLAIQAQDGSPQPSISMLVNLQMFIILSRKNIVVPKTIWDMVNLRHLYIKAGENLIEEPCYIQVIETSSSGLGSLQTLSQVSPQSCHNIFSRTPNLWKLGFCGPLISSLGDIEFPNIRSLEHLQKLKLLNTIPYPEPTRSCNPLMFPEKLKKLTLSNTGLDWEEMWTFAWLPNLEVLKLRVHACIGEKWDTSDSVFRRLKVLKLHDLDLKQWFCTILSTGYSERARDGRKLFLESPRVQQSLRKFAHSQDARQ